MSVIRLEGLAIGYPQRHIANKISLSLPAGSALAILGPNGSGKTTLLRTMLGLLPPINGNILLSGESIARMSPARIAKQVAYVPQYCSSFDGFSVFEVVQMARAPHLGWFGKPGAKDRQLADQALQRLSIAHFADQAFSALSGGERQLVLLARALATEATCLLLDEPTTSLDFGNRLLILETLLKLKASGVCIVFTTHDPQHAQYVCGAPDDAVFTISRAGDTHIGPLRDAINVDALAKLYGLDVAAFDHFGGGVGIGRFG